MTHYAGIAPALGVGFMLGGTAGDACRQGREAL